MIKTLNSLDKGGNIVDLTTATDDYPLAIGETATITYTSATSVPLHVATGEGLYTLDILGEYSATATGGTGYLKPNNSNATLVKKYRGFAVTPSFQGFQQGDDSSVGFFIGDGKITLTNAVVSTKTTGKSQSVNSICIATGSLPSRYNTQYFWTDTTTAWTSLGTIAFAEAQSGKIVIRRII